MVRSRGRVSSNAVLARRVTIADAAAETRMGAIRGPYTWPTCRSGLEPQDIQTVCGMRGLSGGVLCPQGDDFSAATGAIEGAGEISEAAAARVQRSVEGVIQGVQMVAGTASGKS